MGGAFHNQTLIQSLQVWAGLCRPGTEEGDTKKQGVSMTGNPGKVVIGHLFQQILWADHWSESGRGGEVDSGAPASKLVMQ